MWWRRSWFSLNGTIGIQGQERGALLCHSAPQHQPTDPCTTLTCWPDRRSRTGHGVDVRVIRLSSLVSPALVAAGLFRAPGIRQHQPRHAPSAQSNRGLIAADPQLCNYAWLSLQRCLAGLWDCLPAGLIAGGVADAGALDYVGGCVLLLTRSRPSSHARWLSFNVFDTGHA